jgi:aspartyl-tRNA(Asn)/glutamyl-tRNA(Gln) amidotransferase subunit A
MGADVTSFTLTGLAAAFRQGTLRPTDVVQRYLEKIEAGETYRVVTADRALSQAEKAEKAFDNGIDRGPLQGIPIALKDLMDTAGVVTAAGSQVLARGEPAAQDCQAAARLDAAGAVFLGKTNMTELAFSGIGINPHFGTAGSAFDRARVPGGSSSGSGVAVATGLACAAVGSDTGGSVRIPAAFNGIVGLKTTDGLIPMQGCVPLSTTLDTLGPMTRTTADAWALFTVLADRPYRPLEPLTGPLTLLAPTTILQEGLEPEVGARFEAACGKLEQSGHRIVHREVPILDEIRALYHQYGYMASYEALALYEDLISEHGEEMDPRVRHRIMEYAHRPAKDYLRLLHVREKIVPGFWEELKPFDAVLAPTVPITPPEFEALIPDEAYYRANGLCLRNTSPFNFLSGPAASVPAGLTASGLPVGLMVATPPHREELALQIGALLEG